MKKSIYVLLFTMILLMGLTTISNAAFSVQSKTVESGETFSISLTSGTAMDSYTVRLLSYDGLTFNSCSKSKSSDSEVIQVSGGSIGYMNTDGTTTSLGTYSFTAPTVSADKTYKISFNVDNEATVTSTITVKAPAPTEAPKPTAAPTAKPTTEPTTAHETTPEPTAYEKPAEPVVTPEPTKSSNANLGNLGIRPNDFSGFTPENTSYNVSVPYEVDSIEVYAVKKEDAQSVEGTGTKSLSEGSNICEVTVTAEDGTKKTYRITVVRLAKEETNNPEVENPEKKVEIALASLQIVSVNLNEPFKPDVFEYTATAKADAKEVIVSGSANTESAVVDIDAPEEYKVGENTIKITVREKDGDNKKVYTVKVTKAAAEKKDGKTEKANTVAAIGKIEDNNNTNGGSGIPKETLIFCVGIAVVTLLGITFAVIRYRKDQRFADEMEDESEIDTIGDISAKEAIIDAAVATNKLANTSAESPLEADGENHTRRKGRHF